MRIAAHNGAEKFGCGTEAPSCAAVESDEQISRGARRTKCSRATPTSGVIELVARSSRCKRCLWRAMRLLKDQPASASFRQKPQAALAKHVIGASCAAQSRSKAAMGAALVGPPQDPCRSSSGDPDSGVKRPQGWSSSRQQLDPS